MPDYGTFIDLGGAVRNVLHTTYGGIGDGVANDRAALAAVDVLAGTPLLPAGTYLVSGSNLTLNNRWRFESGAMLKPASGITVTLERRPDAGMTQIFDLSAGGTVVFGAGSGREVHPEWWGARPGGGDSAPAIQAALDSLLDINQSSGVVRLSAGYYSLLSSGIRLSHSRQHLVGAGMHSTTLVHDDPAGGDCIRLEKGTHDAMYQCSIRGLSIVTNDTDVQRTAIHVVTQSGLILEEIATFNWTHVGDLDNIGIRSEGWEVQHWRNCSISADIPIQLEPNPNDANISVDHYSLTDLELKPASTQPCIRVLPDTLITELRVERGDWLGGAGGLEWVGDTHAAACAEIVFRQIRWEGGTGWFFDIERTAGQIQHLKFDQCRCSHTSDGWRLRNTRRVTLDNCQYAGQSPRTFMHARDNRPTGGAGSDFCEHVEFRNVFVQSGALVNMENMRQVWAIESSTYPTESNALWDPVGETRRRIKILDTFVHHVTTTIATGTSFSLDGGAAPATVGLVELVGRGGGVLEGGSFVMEGASGYVTKKLAATANCDVETGTGTATKLTIKNASGTVKIYNETGQTLTVIAKLTYVGNT